MSGNTIDADEVRRAVADIEGMLAELLSLRGAYMAQCKGVRERIKAAKDEAADNGIPRKALNIELKRRELERKIDGLMADADEDDADLAQQIREALGDFANSPLGLAALGESGEAPEKPKKRTRKAKAAAPADKSAALDEIAADDERDLRPRFNRDAETSTRVAENVERLSGIKPLN